MRAWTHGCPDLYDVVVRLRPGGIAPAYRRGHHRHARGQEEIGFIVLRRVEGRRDSEDMWKTCGRHAEGMLIFGCSQAIPMRPSLQNPSCTAREVERVYYPIAGGAQH